LLRLKPGVLSVLLPRQSDTNEHDEVVENWSYS
jgi:hypothetical protein